MSQRALGRRQFEQHTPAPDVTERSAPRTPEPNPYSPQGRTPLPSGDRPAGMRGSITDRQGLKHRLVKQQQGRDRWKSLQMRHADADVDDEEEDIPLHPRTGLPVRGEIATSAPTHPDPRLGPIPSIGMSRGAVPKELSFHESAPSARNAVGSLEWIPVQGVRTVQPTVSAQRVHQALEHPETTQNPRIPRHLRPDVPHVYASQDHDHMGAMKGENFTIIDGNHRMSAHILHGHQFAQARVLRDKDIPGVVMRTKAVERAKKRAEWGQAERGVEEDVRNREANLYYGTANW